jgi:hypothetical protein
LYKKYKGSDQILVQAGGKMLLSAIHKLMSSVSNEEEIAWSVEEVYYSTHSQKG